MKYTVQKLAELAGVSARTLRYYDEIDLLKPASKTGSGYRIYGRTEVDKLQQILFYRELGFDLEHIAQLVNDPSFDRNKALKEHYQQLLEKRNQLDILLTNVEKTIAASEGRSSMTDKEKFEGFKRQLIEENEKNYGEEVRAQYGSEAVNQSNFQLAQMTKQQHEDMVRLEKEMIRLLLEAMETNDPESEPAQKAAKLHKQWLTFYWGHYSEAAHAGLADMYVTDERFTAYYDQHRTGAAMFLKNAIHAYVRNRQ